MPYVNPVPDIKSFTVDNTKPQPQDYNQKNEMYFAFIDVLGFKKTFQDMKISQKKDVADKFKDIFNYYFELMNASSFMSFGNSSSCYAGQTSDSLYFYTDRTDFLFEFIKIFSHFNLYAMSKDVFFRGGIAKGSLYTKAEYQFYGDSVIGAYLIESNISKNPIIVIDENTHNDMIECKDYLQFVDTVNDRHYIKPFELLLNDFEMDLEDYELREIDRDLILKNIKDNKHNFEYDDKNYSKYKFLLSEYNKSVKEENNNEQ